MKINNKRYCLFYGTLRRQGSVDACYNFDRFGDNTQQFIKKIELPGFEMYNLGYYPCIVDSDSQNKIICELHAVDSRAASQIESMEYGAGYDKKEIEVEVDGKKEVASIFYYKKSKFKFLKDRVRKIDSGDWCE